MNSLSERISLEDLQKNFSREVYQSAQKLFKSGALLDLQPQNKESVIAGTVAEGHEEYQARVKFDADNLLIHCSCETIEKGIPCVHVITLLIGWIENREYLLNTLENQGFIEVLAEENGQLEKKSSTISLSQEEAVADYRQWLDYFTVNQLRELAANRKVKVSGQHRDVILAALAAGLADSKNLKETVQALSPLGRKIIDLLLILSEGLEPVSYKNLFQCVQEALEIPDGDGLLENAFNDLFQNGLAFNLDGRVRLPKAVSAFTDSNSILFPKYSDPLDRVDETRDGEFTKIALWLALLSQMGFLECTKDSGNVDPWGWPGGSSSKESRASFRDHRERNLPPLPHYLKQEVLKRLAYLTNSTAIEIDYVARLMEKVNFWEEQSPSTLTQSSIQWLQGDFISQCRSFLAEGLLLETPVELEMAREAGKFLVKYDTYMQFQYKTFLLSLARARRMFYKILTILPPQQWIDFESILKTIHGILPDFIRENSNPRLLWLDLNGSIMKPADYAQWRKSYGLFYQAIFTGPAYWMGICKIGWKGNLPVALQVTPFGEALLDAHKAYSPVAAKSEPHVITFEKDGTITVNPTKATPEVINLMLLIARISVPTTPGNDRAATQLFHRLIFRVQNMGIGQAFKAGWTPERIQKVLQEASGEALPTDFITRIQLCWEHFARLHIYTDLALLQLGDDYCLPELIASTRLSQYLLYKFSPTLVAVRPEGVQELLDELRAKGYTPRVMERTIV